MSDYNDSDISSDEEKAVERRKLNCHVDLGPKDIRGDYLAEGFSQDCEDLIARWLKLEVKNYHEFCKLWKDMEFGTVYEYRQSSAEILELCEELVFIAKYYMVYPADNIEESIAGLFLVYGLLGLQPLTSAVAVRFTPNDLTQIYRIQNFAVEHMRMDVLYILAHVLIKGPVQYVCAEREYGIESNIMKYYNGDVRNVHKFSSCKKFFSWQLKTKPLEEVNEARLQLQKYIDAKNRLTGYKGRKETKEVLMDEIQGLMRQIMQAEARKRERKISKKGKSRTGRSTKGKAARAASASESLTKVLIKERAMKSKVSDVKFLHSVQPGPSTSFASPEGPSEENSTATSQKRKRSTSSSDSNPVVPNITEELKIESMTLEVDSKNEIMIETPDGDVVKVEVKQEIEDEDTGWTEDMDKILEEAIADQSKVPYRVPKNLILKGKLKRLGILEVAGYSEHEYMTRNEKKKLRCQAEAIKTLFEAKKKAKEDAEASQEIQNNESEIETIQYPKDQSEIQKPT